MRILSRTYSLTFWRGVTPIDTDTLVYVLMPVSSKHEKVPLKT